MHKSLNFYSREIPATPRAPPGPAVDLPQPDAGETMVHLMPPPVDLEIEADPQTHPGAEVDPPTRLETGDPALLTETETLDKTTTSMMLSNSLGITIILGMGM
jgi:hypothetical protein